MAIGPMTEAERYRFDLHGFLVRRGVLGAGERRRAARGDRRARPAPAGPGPRQPALQRPPAGRPPLPRPHRPPGRAGDRPRDRAGRTCASTTPTGSSCRRARAASACTAAATPFDPPQYYLVDGGRIRSGLVAAQWALVDHPPGGRRVRVHPRQPQVGVRAAGDVRPRPRRAGAARRRRRRRVQRGADPRHAAVAVGASERRTLVYKYSPGNSAWSQAGWPPELLAACTDRQRLLLQPPSVGHHRPDRRRLLGTPTRVCPAAAHRTRGSRRGPTGRSSTPRPTPPSCSRSPRSTRWNRVGDHEPLAGRPLPAEGQHRRRLTRATAATPAGRRSGRWGGSACPGAACSTAWVVQPTVRLTANVGVNSARGQARRGHHDAGEELDVARQRAVRLDPGQRGQDALLDVDGLLDELARRGRWRSRAAAPSGGRGCGRRRGRSP